MVDSRWGLSLALSPDGDVQKEAGVAELQEEHCLAKSIWDRSATQQRQNQNHESDCNDFEIVGAYTFRFVEVMAK